MEEVLGRVGEVARGAAIMAGVESKLTVQAGDYEMLVNMAGAKLLQENLEWVGPATYTAEEQEFAKGIQRATGKPEKGINGKIRGWRAPAENPPGGSTDVGDVSWVVPLLHFSYTTAPEDTPWHSWAVVASGGMSIGHKGMMQAGKVLAATMVDLYEDAAVREAVVAEFREQTKGFVYKPYIPEGPPPVPKD
jgi:aminobenzoyl-glutamate utilization protein B